MKPMTNNNQESDYVTLKVTIPKCYTDLNRPTSKEDGGAIIIQREAESKLELMWFNIQRYWNIEWIEKVIWYKKFIRKLLKW